MTQRRTVTDLADSIEREAQAAGLDPAAIDPEIITIAVFAASLPDITAPLVYAELQDRAARRLGYADAIHQFATRRLARRQPASPN